MQRLNPQVVRRKNPQTQAIENQAIAHLMYELYCQYYAGTSWPKFSADLTEKDAVILLWNEHQELKGFSTLAIWEFEFEKQRMRAIFSGDTIIHHQYWGEQTLAKTWSNLAGQIKAAAPEIPLYWFLIVKGYRTYRYLPVFAKLFYPTWRYPTPANIQALMDYLARKKFGDYYDAESGLIKFPVSQGHLRETWAEIKPGFRQKPDIQYFLQRNPHYDQGHELVCLMELSESNWRSPIALRGFLQGLHQSP